MDVGTLRDELEEQLKNNPDEHAPSGFRDRFEATVEGMEAADDAETKAALEAQLRQIRAEAEAAVKCACGEDEQAPAPSAEQEEAAAEAPPVEAKMEEFAPAEPAIVEAKVEDSAPAEPAIVEANVDDHEAAASPTPEPVHDPVAEPAAGLMQRYGLVLAAALVALVVAIYFYR